MDGTVSIKRSDLFGMLLSNTRYALGRNTFVVDEARELLQTYGRHLTAYQLMLIVKDIKREIVRDRPLMQKETWERTAAELENLAHNKEDVN